MYSRQLDRILSKIIKVMNEIKKVNDMVIGEHLEQKLKRLGLRHNKWNQGYWKKKRNCEKVIYSLWNSKKSKKSSF